MPFDVVAAGCAANMRAIFGAIAAGGDFNVSAATQLGIERARDGGASLIVCVPLRPDGAAENAVISMEQYLAGKKLFRNLWKDQALAEFNREITAACLPPADPLA